MVSGEQEPKLTLHDLCLDKAKEFLSVCRYRSRRRTRRRYCWNGSPPKDHRIKLNSDGAVDQATGRAGAWSILGDTDDRWIKGSTPQLGTNSSALFELWGLLDGLGIVRDLGIEYLTIELGVLVIINLVSNNLDTNIPFLPLINDCRRYARGLRGLVAKHAYRECNGAVDSLARMANQCHSFCFNGSLDFIWTLKCILSYFD